METKTRRGKEFKKFENLTRQLLKVPKEKLAREKTDKEPPTKASPKRPE